MQFLFIGQGERVYPEVVIEGKVLIAHPGDRRRFDGEPPRDGLWVEDPAPKPSKPDTAALAKES